MIIVHGEMRCGTTWCAQMLSRVGNLGVVHEPYNPEWHKSDWIQDPETETVPQGVERLAKGRLHKRI